MTETSCARTTQPQLGSSRNLDGARQTSIVMGQLSVIGGHSRRGSSGKRRLLYGRYHPPFADFRAAIEETLNSIPTTHATDLASLMTLNFQRFENVSLMAA